MSSSNQQALELPKTLRIRSRFKNPIGKYRLNRTDVCIQCGKCAEICPYGVHVMRRGRVLVENAYLCVGVDCDHPCHDMCPVGALSLRRNPDFDVMGDL